MLVNYYSIYKNIVNKISEFSSTLNIKIILRIFYYNIDVNGGLNLDHCPFFIKNNRKTKIITVKFNKKSILTFKNFFLKT